MTHMECETNWKSGHGGVLGTLALSLLLVLSCDPRASAAAERVQRDAARAMQADIAALSDSEAEPAPNEEESSGEGKQDGTPSASASDGDAGTEEPASPEVVRFVFDKNASRGADSHVSGTMDDYEFPMDDKPHSLPKNAYSRSNHDFVGWSLTADGRDVADNPETADIDETFRTLMIKDGLEMTNLGYDERIEEKSVDEHGNEVTQTRILPRNLEYAVREHEVRLYAQWKERPPNDARATSADDVTAKDDAPAADDATTESELESDDDGIETRQTQTQVKAETQPDAGPNEPAAKTDTESDAGSTGSTANSPKASVAPMGRDEETTDDGDLASVNMAEVDGVRAVTVEGDDLSDAVIAKSVRRSLGASGATADEAIRALASKSPAQPLRMSAPQDDDIPRDLDGSTIESVLVSWVTPDDAPDGDESRLSMRPPNDDPQTVRMRVSYALSGQHDYPAGDVTITVPAEMFSYRDGSPAGRWVIPYPQEPSATNDFMWSRVGDTFVLTNARRLSAATKGYIEFQVENLVPHRLVDQGVTEPFWARIEAATHLGNTIGLTSNSIDAVIDTESKVTSAYKYNYDSSIEIVDEDEIPEGARVSGEHEYVLVSWYMYAWVGGNTEFTLDLVDRRGDEYSGRRVLPTVGDATQPYSQRVLSGYRTGSVGYATVQYAYPLSQFAPDVTHTFENTVTYTLTETDPAEGDDPRLVTTASHTATRPWAWHAPEFRIPQGHFMLQKYGNDGKDGNNPFPYAAHNYRGYYSPRLDTTIDNFQGWYGIYPSALNDLAEGSDTEIAYTLQSIGYVMPWTYDGTSDLRKMSSYGVRPVTMVTTDADDALEAPTWLLAAGKVPLQANTDFDYVAVEFPATPYIAKATRVNLDENGNFVALHAGDGTFDYQADTDISHVPDITLEAKVDGSWRPVATASWSSGQLGITAYDTLSTGSRVILPPGTEQLRTSVTTTNAAVSYYVRPIVRIRSDGAVGNAARAALATSNAPSMQLYNSSGMVAYDADGEEIVDIHKEEQDTLQGYSTDVAVIPSKHMAQSQSDVDYDTRKVTVHYSAEIQERSLIPDRITYEQAKRDGKLVPDTQGVFYDLLPKGMTPVMESVRLREADRIESANTIENWRGTGRTMLIVRARLLPLTKSYEDSGVRRFMDELRISFDATYPFAEMKDYGTTPHNVIAYESLVRSPLGSIEHHGAEPDDPRSRNNDATAEAFADDGERDAMTLLDATKTGDRFVYAGASGTIDIPSAAFTSLSKLVQVNGDGRWSTGLADDRRNVYEGGLYDYQLRMMSEIGTLSKNLVMYDSLEEFRARQGNEPEDIDAPRWQGTLLSVDVSQLRALGCEPVVYYSTQENLQLADETDPDVAHPTNTDLSQSSIWVKAEDYEHDHADLSGVHAVAIDCRKATGGTDDFILGSLQSAVAILRMWAPSGEPAREYIAQDAHAYNNIYLHCTSIGSETLVENSDSFVHADYTKVGLEEMSVSVRKEWEDDDDRDGVRPQSLTVRLLANGQETGLSAQLQAPSWSGRIDNVPYTDGHGQKIEYMLVEDVPDGYESSIERGTEWTYEIRNRHEPERTSVSGTKIWEGGENARPAYVTVRLLADGKEAQRRIVSPDADGEWKYSFDNLLRYRDGGTEIAYRVEEVPEDPRWVVSSDGNDIVNTYHPFGDLSISKTCRGQTPVEAGQQFEMRLSLLGTDGHPLAGEYAYSVSDGNGHPLRSGTVSHGDSVMLADGETATVREIPHGTQYQVEEVVPDGYSLIDASGTDGTIRANGTRSASLTNLYHAEGSINLHATKQLSGRALRRHQFRAELQDADGNLLRTATNQADGSMTFGALSYTETDARGEPYVYTITETQRDLSGYTFDSSEYRAYVTVTDNGNGTLSTSVRYENESGGTVAAPEFRNEYHANGSLSLKAWKQLKGRPLQAGEFAFELRDENGAVLQTATNGEDGLVEFAPIAYDEGDAGQSFSYIVKETAGSDATVIYSDEAYQYEVSVTDNGDGTLSFSQSAEEVELRERYMNSGDLNRPETDFNLGRTDVWIFRGKQGSAAETLYVLPKVDPPNYPTTTSPTVDPEVTAITTPADAVAWMNAHFEGLNMSESDIGSSGFFVDTSYITLNRTWLGDWPALREWLGENIDGSLGEGELKCVAFMFYGGANTSDIIWKNSSASSSSVYAYNLTGEHVYDVVHQDQPEIVAPVFTNTLKPGALRIEKHVDEVPEGHEDNQFRFKVRLSGEDIEDGQYEYVHEQIPTSTAVAGEGASGVRRIIESVWESLCDILSPREALAEPDILWQDFTQNGSSFQWYVDEEGNLRIRAIAGTTGTMQFASSSEIPWPNTITSIHIDQGHTIHASGSFYGLFAQDTSLIAADLTGLDTSDVTNMANMFIGCYCLESLVLPDSFVTSNVTTMRSMFYNCASLSSLDLSNFATSEVRNMGSMFGDCRSLTSLVLPDTFDTSNVTDMECMFDNCYNLVSLTLPDTFNTSHVTKMNNMFNDCRNLESLNLPTAFDTSNAIEMAAMFSECRTLVSLSLPSAFNTSRIASMASMFAGCRNLVSLTLPSAFNTSNVTDMTRMFENCSRLTSLTLSDSFDTSNVTNMYRMFQGCSSLMSIDLSHFNTAKVTNMGSMFSECNQLSSITLGTRNALRGYALTMASGPSGSWENIATGAGPKNFAQLAEMGPDLSTKPEFMGEWTKVTPGYRISFDPDEGSGAMPTVKVDAPSETSIPAYTIPPSTFRYFGHSQTGWDDGNGNTYGLEDTIPANKYANGSRVVLYATWGPEDTTLELANGEMELFLGPNEAATFESLPAGTAYTVYEETPEGWVLVSQGNTSGNILPNATATASFTNRYDEASTSASLVATKTLDGQGAEAGAFRFELREGGRLIESVTNSQGGGVAFSPIVYGEGDVGTHTYTITEVAGNDENIVYDGHTEIAEVTVTKNGTNMLANVAYDADGAAFANATIPGSIRIEKQTQGGGDPDQEFEFELELKNTQAGEITGESLPVASGTALAKAMSSPVDILSMIMNLLSPTVAEASEGRIDAGIAYAIETDDSQLVFFRSNMTYQEGETRTVTDVAGHSYHGIVHTGCEGDGYAANKWSHENITAVRVSDGCLIRPQTMESWFNDMPNLTNVDLRGMDTSGTTYMWNCIANCPKLTTVDLSELDVSGFSYSHTILYGVPMLRKISLGEKFDTQRAYLSLDPNEYNTTYWTNTSVPDAEPVSSQALRANYDGSATTGNYARGTYVRKGSNVMILNPDNWEGVITTAVIDLTKSYSGTYYDTLVDDLGNIYSGYAYYIYLNGVPSWDSSARGRTRTIRVAEGTHIAPTSCDSWFQNFTALTSIDLDNLDFSQCTDMDYMLQSTPNLGSIDVSHWDTSKVTTTNCMFQESGITSFDLTTFDMTSLRDPYRMFTRTRRLLTVNARGLHAPKLDRMTYMFSEATALQTADFSNANVENLTSLSSMFWGAVNLVSADFSDLHAPRCTSMTEMFYRTSAKTIDFSRADLSSVSSCSFMFSSQRTGHYTRIPGSSISFIGAKLGTSLYAMFRNAGHFETINFQYADTSRVTDTSFMFNEAYGLSHVDLRGLDLSQVTTCRSMFENALADYSSSAPGYLVDARDVTLGSTTEQMFNECGLSSVSQQTYGVIDLTGADTSRVTNTFQMFVRAEATEIRMPNLDLSSVTTANEMFNVTSGFTEYTSVRASVDLSGAKFGASTAGMFANALLTDINLFNVDTSDVTDMSNMFLYTRTLSNLSIQGMSTANVTNMDSMFANTNLETLDVSEFDTRKVTSMDSMFAGSHLRTIYSTGDAEWDVTSAVSDGAPSMFSSSSSVIGGNGTAYDESAIDVSMARVDGLDGAPGYFTIGTGEAVVQFDPNGGSVLVGDTEIVQRTRITPVSFPTVVSNGNVLVGWNTKADGTGEAYPLANRIVPEPGKVIHLFAQWMPEGDAYSYEVIHRQERANALGEYEIVGHETRHAGTLFGVTAAPNQYPGFETPPAQTIDIEADGSTSVTFDYVRKRFTVTFDGNGFAESSTQEFAGGIRQTLAPAPVVEGKRFVGWSGSPDGSGGFFTDGQAVMLDSPMTLYAHYVDAAAASEQVGLSTTMHLRVKAGESITVPNIPAGTIYSVREVAVPDGWEVEGITGGEGTVSSNTVSVVTARNRYSASGTFDIVAYKTLAERAPLDGEFSFRLYDQEGAIVGEALNDGIDERITVPDPVTGDPVLNAHYGQSVATFRDIPISEPGTYHYTIREVDRHDPEVRYDNHMEAVTVVAVDRFNGTLDCMVSYDADGALFENALNGSTLEIRKHVSVPSPSGESPAFGFDVSFADASGNPLPDGTFQVERPNSEGATQTKIFKTDNLDDTGHKVSDYDDNKNYSSVISIPNAEALTFDIDYSDARGEFLIWSGSYPGIAPQSYNSAVNPGTAAASIPSSSNYTDLLHTTVTVPGDTATILYHSTYLSPSSYPNYTEYTNYGAYVRVSGSPPEIATPVEVRNGKMHLSIGDGGFARILDLPIGTTYSITEEELLGWHTESSEGENGTLVAGQDATASFTNAYSASGKFSVRGTKRIAGGMLPKDGEFSFVLTDDSGAFVARATNGADGEFSFPEFPIDPAWVGTTAAYHVVEEKGTDENIIYDEHVEDVSVTFSDDGEGTLSGAVTYDSDGCRFTNTRRIAMPDAGSSGLGWGGTILGTIIVTAGCIAAESRRRRLRSESPVTGK